MSEGADGDDPHARFLRSRPPPDRLARLVAHLEPGGRITAVRRLKGGTEASTHRVDLVTRSGAAGSVVVRRFHAAARWYDPDRLPREAATLASLVETPVPAPECLLVDVPGEWLGTPAMVLTRLPGRPAPPDRWVAWAGSLAEAAAAIHAVRPVVEAEDWLTGWRSGAPPASLVDDPWVARVWPLVTASAPALAGSGGDALVHHDLHPGNTLWSRGRVAGVVDWPMAGRGYPAYDRAYLRLDVSICHGLAAGDGVAAALRAVAGTDDHPAWDLVVGLRALPDPDAWVAVYRELGAPVTVAEGRARLAAWFERAASQLR